MLRTYYDEKRNRIEEGDGWLFINGECVNEPGTDEDFDTYSVQVQNGEGYYSNGKYISYKEET